MRGGFKKKMDEQLTTAEHRFCSLVAEKRGELANTFSYGDLKLKFKGQITEARMDELIIKVNTQPINW